MTAFTPDQWLVLLLAFLLGLVLGMAFLANPKWKKRYREEAQRREALEAENAQLRRDAAEMDSLRHAAAKDEARRRDDEAPGAALALPERRLRRRQPGDRDAVGRGADIIEAGRLAEGDAGGIAAMLAANAELEAGLRRPAPLDGERDQLADALDVEADERDRARRCPSRHRR